MENEWVDFKAVKEAVSIERVLDHYGVKLRRVNAHYLRGRCPLPTHVSDKSRESFGADTGKNAWACQSDSCVKARGGRRGGNVLDFVAMMENSSVRDAALNLQNWFGVSSTPKTAPDTRRDRTGGADAQLVLKEERPVPANGEKQSATESRGGESAQLNKPLAFALKGIDPSHPYLAKRGSRKRRRSISAWDFSPAKARWQAA